jgi:hypothetical protein
MSEHKIDSKPQDSVESAPARGRPGRPRALDDYARGKLAICLAVGFTQREAAAWVGASRKSVRTALADPEFKRDLERCTAFAQVHPLLRMYQAAAESWRVAARLLDELEAQLGPLTTDELIEGMTLVLEQVNAGHRANTAEES